MGYDGSINIDTQISTKGMEKGTKSITSSLGGVLRSVKGVAAALGLAFSGAAIFNFIKKIVSQFDIMSSSVGGKIKELKNAFDLFKGALANSVLALVSALTPYIIIAVTWLTKMLTTLSAIIAVLFGVKTAMSGVTDETKDATKAAKGSLAAFDQINVLGQTENNNNAAPILPAITIPADLLANVESFKKKMLDFLQPVIDALGRLYDALKPLGETIWAGLKWAWDNILVPLGAWVISDLLPAFLDVLSGALDVLNEILIAIAPIWLEFFDNFLKPLAEWTGGKIIEFLDWLALKLGELAVWIKENPEKFREFVNTLGILLISVGAFFSAIVVFTSGLTALTTLGLAAIIAFIIMVIANWEKLGTTVKQIIFIIIYYIQTVKSAIMEGFGTALDWVKDRFATIFNGIKDFVKGVINTIIDYINSMMDSVSGGINSIISGANTIGGLVPGFTPISELSAPQIPRLATGAVIPPNAEFAAILGDQRSGKNIEAPENLIRQIVSEEIGKIQADVTINFAGTLAGLVRELKPYIDKENIRVGGSLIQSGGTG